MRDRSKGRRAIAALAPLLLGLAACAGRVATAKPSTEHLPDAENPVKRAVRELLANREAGQVRTVSGVGYVLAPIAVFLANGEVSLLPSTPDLESAMARLQRQWLAGRRQPLPYDAFRTAFARLTAQRNAVGQETGGEALIHFAKTDDKGNFTFEQVPEGRWLLVADMSSPVSILLWAVPVEVGAEDPAPLFLGEGNLLLEALVPQKAVRPR